MRRILAVFLVCVVAGVCRGEEENNTLSQALQALDVREFDQAQALFDRYIGALPEEEQALFKDVSYLSSRSEMEIYKDADDPAEMIRRFWARLDPSPLTQTNERLLEHYKRVAHARRHFSEGRFPWDDRGEVHIRFGAPDHISSSRDMQMEMDREIQNARINFVNRRRLALAIKPGQPIFPVSSMVRWEYWVYVNLDRGTEITFVSQFPKVFEYAQIPDGLGVSLIADLMAFQGARIVQDLVSKSPSVYVPDFADLPIDFFYYPAGFRGSEGQTRLEVYYGLPASEMSRLPVNEQTDLV
ncbi:MAG: GWxTD domain-containing protein, partial [bacterium]|nr:GWxTD domain-containing protein [bacterium]